MKMYNVINEYHKRFKKDVVIPGSVTIHGTVTIPDDDDIRGIKENTDKIKNSTVNLGIEHPEYIPQNLVNGKAFFLEHELTAVKDMEVTDVCEGILRTKCFDEITDIYSKELGNPSKDFEISNYDNAGAKMISKVLIVLVTIVSNIIILKMILSMIGYDFVFLEGFFAYGFAASIKRYPVEFLRNLVTFVMFLFSIGFVITAKGMLIKNISRKKPFIIPTTKNEAGMETFIANGFTYKPSTADKVPSYYDEEIAHHNPGFRKVPLPKAVPSNDFSRYLPELPSDMYVARDMEEIIMAYAPSDVKEECKKILSDKSKKELLDYHKKRASELAKSVTFDKKVKTYRALTVSKCFSSLAIYVLITAFACGLFAYCYYML